MPPLPAFDKEGAKWIHFRHLAKHASPSQAEPLPASFVAPNAYWASVEKAAFFRSLARHSRWRPDLISDDIGGGKSIADVCSYIEQLEQGLHDARKTWHSRDKLPVAREVSEDWMHAEESIAEVLQVEDGEWQRSALKRKRAEAVKAVKQSFRPGGARDPQESRDAATALNSTNPGSEMEENNWRERFKKRKKELADIWKREDFLSSLDEKTLKAMEIMVRTLERDEKETELEASMEAHENAVPNAVPSTVLELPSDLSPNSKRRLRKRLWMRKKRALLNGLPTSEVSTDTRKLKPGRKGKLIQDEDRSEETEEETKKRRPPGCAKLDYVAVDGIFLRTAGLDLFCLENFAGLTSVINDAYRPRYQSQESVEVTIPTLSYPFLLLLRAHLAHFLSRLIGQIVVQNQVEAQQKKRFGGGIISEHALTIRSNNVHEALNIIGHAYTSKSFFRRLKNRVRDAAAAGDHEALRAFVDSDDSNGSPLSDPSSADSNSEMSEDTEFSDNLDDPCDDLDSARRPSLPSQSEFQLLWNPIADKGDDALLLEDLDEDALLKELKAEEVVDSRDRAADRALEDSLWQEIGVQQTCVPIEEPSVLAAISEEMQKGAKSLRFCEPGGAVKSRVYINDSDEDDWEGRDQGLSTSRS